MRRALFLFPLLILACTENLERRPEALNRGRQILGELNLKPLKKEIRHKKYPLRQKVFHGPIHALAQSPSEELLLVKDSDPHLKLVSLRDLKVAARLPLPRGALLRMGISRDQGAAFSLHRAYDSDRYHIQLYDLRRKRATASFHLQGPTVRAVHFLGQTRQLLLLSGASDVHLYRQGHLTRVYSGGKTLFASFRPLASGAGFMAAVESDPAHGTLEQVLTFSLKTQKLRRFRPRSPWVHYALTEDALYINDGKELVRYSTQFQIQEVVWRTVSGRHNSLRGARGSRALFHRSFGELSLLSFDHGGELYRIDPARDEEVTSEFTPSGRQAIITRRSSRGFATTLVDLKRDTVQKWESSYPLSLTPLATQRALFLVDKVTGHLWRSPLVGAKERLHLCPTMSTTRRRDKLCGRTFVEPKGAPLRTTPTLTHLKKLYVPRRQTELGFSPKGTYLYTVENALLDRDQPRVTLWNHRGWWPRERKRLFRGHVRRVLIAPNEKELVATGWKDSFVEPQKMLLGRFNVPRLFTRKKEPLPLSLYDPLAKNHLLAVTQNAVYYQDKNGEVVALDNPLTRPRPLNITLPRGAQALQAGGGRFLLAGAPNPQDLTFKATTRFWLYRLSDGELVKTWLAREVAAWGVSPEGAHLWILQPQPKQRNHANLQVFSLPSLTLEWELKKVAQAPYTLLKGALARDGAHFALAHPDRGLALWAKNKKAPARRETAHHGSSAGPLAFSPKENILAHKSGKWVHLYKTE